MDGAKESPLTSDKLWQEPLTPGLIAELKRQGLNLSDIARLKGVSRQRVSFLSKQSNVFPKTARETMKEHYPWDTSGGFFHHYVDLRMRDHGEWIWTDGKALSEDRRKKLRYFYNSLANNDQVIEFDPHLPPSGQSSIGGFAYRPRVATDGHLMIRVNEYTTLTDVGESLWRMPEREEWP